MTGETGSEVSAKAAKLEVKDAGGRRLSHRLLYEVLRTIALVSVHILDIQIL